MFSKQHPAASGAAAPAIDQRRPAFLNRFLTMCLQAPSIWRLLKSCDIARKKLTRVADERDRPDLDHRHAVVIQINGASDRFRHHADLILEHARANASIMPPPRRKNEDGPKRRPESTTELARHQNTKTTGEFCFSIDTAFRNLRRNADGSDAQQRRHLHHGQPRQPQNRSSARDGPMRRRPPAVPSILLPRPQPDQTGVRQAQVLPADRPTANPKRKGALVFIIRNFISLFQLKPFILRFFQQLRFLTPLIRH